MCVKALRPNRFKQPTICFETEEKNGYPLNMFISPKYILSDRLQAGLSCDSLLLIIGVSFGAIFMSVNIAERPTFEKKTFALIKVCFQMYLLSISYFIYLIFTSKAESKI